jgi:hypothetical protein
VKTIAIVRIDLHTGKCAENAEKEMHLITATIHNAYQNDWMEQSSAKLYPAHTWTVTLPL